jgi:hypothetical protein
MTKREGKEGAVHAVEGVKEVGAKNDDGTKSVGLKMITIILTCTFTSYRANKAQIIIFDANMYFNFEGLFFNLEVPGWRQV